MVISYSLVRYSLIRINEATKVELRLMFDKFKQAGQLLKMRSEAQKLQRELDQIIETYEKGSVKVKVTGSQKIEYIELDGEERADIKDAINEAMKKVQKEAAQKMLESGGGLSGLLGKIGQ